MGVGTRTGSFLVVLAMDAGVQMLARQQGTYSTDNCADYGQADPCSSMPCYFAGFAQQWQTELLCLGLALRVST